MVSQFEAAVNITKKLFLKFLFSSLQLAQSVNQIAKPNRASRQTERKMILV
jgi:hypothetical protein